MAIVRDRPPNSTPIDLMIGSSHCQLGPGVPQ